LYKINHIKKSLNNQNYLEITNSSKNVYAKIYLNQGASLQKLTLKNQELIKDMYPLPYETTYASSILFPFANRIKDGSYQFNKKKHQLNINEKDLNNAIHGFVYNKTFEIINQETNNSFAALDLSYDEQNISEGFPYTYSIKLKYKFTENTLELKVEIKNTSSKAFPFTLGWHPYFLSNNLYDSHLDFSSSKKIILDERNIATGQENIENNGIFEVLDKSLDDCFVLNSGKVTFYTPTYSFVLKSSEENSFLQLYTPPIKNTLAIEPTTGVSDSFNNGIGLKTLQPNDSYGISWSLIMNDN
tara:strand:+ start:3680 stop:4582 length:903 start_codon:yes stop_codon:yes gene_type:complete